MKKLRMLAITEVIPVQAQELFGINGFENAVVKQLRKISDSLYMTGGRSWLRRRFL